MGVLDLADGEIGLPLRYFTRFIFTRLIFTRLVFTRGWTHTAALAWHPGLAHASVNYFLQGRGTVKGGSMNWYFERQLNVLRSLMKFLRTLMKCLRTSTKTGVYLSSVLGNRSETSRFDSVLAALLWDVSVNLLVTLVRAMLKALKILQRRVRVKFILFIVEEVGARGW